VAFAQADDLQGARVCGRGRQRHRTLVRPARDGRRRADRLSAGAPLRLPDDPIDGRTAAEWGLALEAVPEAELDERVEELADRIASVPMNQLVLQKLMVNQAYDNMGLESTQLLATLFDGITRHTPEARSFEELARREG